LKLTKSDLALLRGFAHGLARPGQKTRAITLKSAVPEIGAAPGDLVVYAAGRVFPDRQTWLVLKQAGRDGKPVYSVDRAPACPRVHAGGLARQVCGRVLFTVHNS
jgi:hypothetical protein